MPFTKAHRRALRRFGKLCTKNHIDPLTDRAKLARIIRDHSESGLMILSVSGTDCDGYSYGPHRSIHTASVMMYELVRNRNFDGADGPIYTRVVTGADRDDWEEASDYNRCDLTTDDYRNFMGLPWDWHPAH